MVCCSIVNCKNRSIKGGNIRFFTFPKEETVANAWLQFCRPKTNIKTGRVCSAHFLNTDYDMPLMHILMKTTPKYKKLKPDSIPSLYINATGQPVIDRRHIKKKTCIVSTCISNRQRNRCNNSITFYMFPKSPDLRKAWVDALGIPSSAVNDESKICSEHFTEGSFYETKDGLRIHTSALPIVKLNLNFPATMMICRICLTHHPKMQNIREFNETFEVITGLPASQGEAARLPQCLCWECAARLTAAASFKAKALLSDGLLRDLLKPDQLLTIRDIKKINRKQFDLKTSLVQKHFDSNHYDVQINDTFVEINNKFDYDLPEDIKEVEIPIESEADEGKVNNFNATVIISEHNYSNNLNTDNKINNTIHEEKISEETIDFKNTDTDYETLQECVVFDSVTNMDEDDSEASESINNFYIEEERTKRKRTIVSQDTILTEGESLPKRIRKNITTVNTETTAKKEKEKKFFIITPLTHEQQMLEMEKRQESAEYIRALHKCNLCYLGFQREDSYQSHIKKHSQAAGPFECYICKIRKPNKGILLRHISEFHSNEYKCRKCKFVTTRRGLLENHVNLHEGAQFKCEHCSEVFLCKTTYLGHLRRIHTSSHVCNLCGFTFLNRLGVHFHMKKQHSLDKDLELKGPYCATCDVKFLSEDAHTRHLRVSSKHLQNENDPIRIKNYPNTARYSSHRRVRTGRFRNPEFSIQDNCEPYTCEQCSKKFTNYRLYTEHFSLSHPNLSPEQLPRGKEPAMCDKCGKVYRSMYNLELHLLAHAGQKMFNCDTCGKSFCGKPALIGHIQSVHEGGPAHKCQYCDKRFATAQSLKKHMGKHLGIRPECKVCGKTFTNVDGLNSHVKHVHYKIPWPKKTKRKVKKENDEE